MMSATIHYSTTRPVTWVYCTCCIVYILMLRIGEAILFFFLRKRSCSVEGPSPLYTSIYQIVWEIIKLRIARRQPPTPQSPHTNKNGRDRSISFFFFLSFFLSLSLFTRRNWISCDLISIFDFSFFFSSNSSCASCVMWVCVKVILFSLSLSPFDCYPLERRRGWTE